MGNKIKMFGRDRGIYEICVICKQKTHIKKDQPIDERYGYIEGVGQLCYDCYKNLKNRN